MLFFTLQVCYKACQVKTYLFILSIYVFIQLYVQGNCKP